MVFWSHKSFLGMGDHYWSIMEGTTVMINLKCGPDFPSTPLPDLPGRCQNQRKLEYSV